MEDDPVAHEIPKVWPDGIGYDDFIRTMPLERILSPEAFEEYLTKKVENEA